VFKSGIILKTNRYLESDSYKPYLFPVNQKTGISFDEKENGYFVWNKENKILIENDLVILVRIEHLKISRNSKGTILYLLHEGQIWHTSLLPLFAFEAMFEVVTL
jgi:hypothetical protein